MKLEGWRWIPRPERRPPRVLLAGPCVSEFGWEIMSWQGRVRLLADAYDHAVISTTTGHEALYADFCFHFIPHRIRGMRTCWFLQHETNELRAAERKLERLRDAFQAAGWHVDRIQPAGFIPPAYQRFVRYGRKSTSLTPDLRFDVILHARAKHSDNPMLGSLNWPQGEWDRLAMALTSQGLRLACIGQPSTALLARGAVDLRGSPLSQTIHALSAARLVAGPSSGPMHLASLCGVPHVVWTLHMDLPAWKRWGSSRDRYERIWNPFGTPCTVIEAAPADVPRPDELASIVLDALDRSQNHG